MLDAPVRRALAPALDRVGAALADAGVPPLADLDPDEFVWSHMKTNGVSKKPLKKHESLRDRVEEDLVKIKADPRLVRSFFGAKSVSYAKD